MIGKLYLCATPIGNLEDITIRALNTLKEADMIAAEDTRHTKKLMNHYDIHTPLTSYHEHNKFTKGNHLIDQLKAGKNIALVTDAGTPGISDPGEDLVKRCHEENIEVTSIPGPVAGITGLIISGLPTRRFVFEGFIPSDKKEKREVLESFKKETRTVIIYESPHRLKQTLKELLSHLGNREIAITRELTKKYEEVIKMTIGEAIHKYNNEDPRGEFVIIISGANKELIVQEEREKWNKYTISEHVEFYVNEGLTEKEAMKKVGKDRGISKREVYAEFKM